MKKAFKIGTRTIQEGGRVFIIAEAGVNHNRRLDLALKLVDAAADAGADAVKFQTFRAEDVSTESGEMASYQIKNIGQKKTQRQMLKDLELPETFYPPIINRCLKRKIMFLSTPHGGKKAVDLLESFKIPAYKIGSGDLNNFLLLSKIAKLKKPVIIGSGMATLKEVKNTVRFLKSFGNGKIVILHCTTYYPCPPEETNLSAMMTLIKQLDVPVGYSDHTLGHQAAIMAAALGAAAYECHLTLDKSLPGPDHIASSTPAELKEKIRLIRSVKTILGNPEKKPTKSEKASMLILARKSIVAARNLKKGQILAYSDIEAKRPGDGLSPVHFKKLLGKKLKYDINKDGQINLNHV